MHDIVKRAGQGRKDVDGITLTQQHESLRCHRGRKHGCVEKWIHNQLARFTMENDWIL